LGEAAVEVVYPPVDILTVAVAEVSDKKVISTIEVID
jgi:hypothetical protein